MIGVLFRRHGIVLPHHGAVQLFMSRCYCHGQHILVIHGGAVIFGEQDNLHILVILEISDQKSKLAFWSGVFPLFKTN